MKPEHIPHVKLNSLKEKHPELLIEDNIDLAIDELFDIENPSKKDSKNAEEVKEFSQKLSNNDLDNWGEWVYYPWLNKAVHFPPVDEFRSLRTSRNRNLITAEEQTKLYGSTILIIGMSVGSNIVEALVSHGIGKKFVLVDMDIIEPSNLNRIRSPYHHVGLEKVEAISRKVWEVDPYIEIVQFNDGLNESNLVKILEENEVDVVVDEMDDLRMKILLREEVKPRKLPLVMAADDGDNILLDVERYDLNPDLDLFSGRIPEDVLSRIKEGKISRPELGMMIGKYFVGADNIPLRMFQSLGEVGKSLPSWPQLGGAAALSGIVIAYVVRKIILGEKIKDGRILVSIDEKIDLEHHDPEHQTQLEKYKGMLGGN